MKTQLLLLTTMISGQAYCQDVRGAYIRTKSISAFTYSVTVTLFTDTALIISRPTITVNFGDATSSIFTLSGISNNNNGTDLKTYSGTHTYSGPGNYIVSYQDLYRVAGIKNISNSQTQPIYVESRININNSLGINSAPIISQYPILFSQDGNTFQFNAGCYDSDGDSLSFSLVNCAGSNYYIPNNTTINPTTGLFSFFSDTLGLYAFSFNIHEWRKNTNAMYETIASSQIDFIVNIISTVGFAKIENKKANFRIYPNPVGDELSILYNQILSKNHRIEIINSLGQIIIQSPYVDKINVTTFPNGVYFLKLVDQENFHSIVKFIKE